MSRIGIFICKCGSNISQRVDVKEVSLYVQTIPGVVYSSIHEYLCSDSEEKLLFQAIQEHNLDGVVLAACSPARREITYRRIAAEKGFNPYLLEMVNLREQCSWVHESRIEATAKAKDLVRMMVEKVKRNFPLHHFTIPIVKRALVIGGGIAGIQAALNIAAGGYEVVLIEKGPSIGGHVVQLAGISTPMDGPEGLISSLLTEIAGNRNIKLYSYSELEDLEGSVGNFTVKIRKKPRSLEMSKCTDCGICQQQCPIEVGSEFNEGLSRRKAIYIPFAEAVPHKPVIDREHCLRFQQTECVLCRTTCPTGAIDYHQEDEIVTEEAGAVVVATGYDVLSIDNYIRYGYGQYPDVITSLQFERLISAYGPTQGELRRPSDGKIPQRIVFILCLDLRDDSLGVSYGSKICSLYTDKHIILFKQRYPSGQTCVFYSDSRDALRNNEKLVRKAIKEKSTIYILARISEILFQNNSLVVRGVETLTGQKVETKADLVVLAPAITASAGAESLAGKLKITSDSCHFFSEVHPLRPVETRREGIFLAGACQSPQNIPESIAQAGAAAGKVLGLFAQPALIRAPLVAKVNKSTCTGCFLCQQVCAYGAIEKETMIDRRGEVIKMVSTVNNRRCQGCGLCAATCRSNSIDIEGFNNHQLCAEISAIGFN